MTYASYVDGIDIVPKTTPDFTWFKKIVAIK